MKAYAKSMAVELLLLAGLASCLATVVLQGFVVAPDLQFNVPLIALASLALQVVPLAGRYRRRNVPWAVIGMAALGAAIVAVGAQTSAGADPLADVEGNTLLFCVVLVAVNVLVAVLALRRASAAMLFVATAWTCMFIEYAYHAGLVAPSLAALVLAAALYLQRGSAPGARVTIVSAAVAGLAGLLALAVWALLVAPLHPGHLDVKLFTEYRTYETVEVTNPVELVLVEDPELTTVTLTDDTVYGNIPVQVDGDDPALASVDDFVQDAREQVGRKDLFRLENDDEGVYLYTYELPSWWWLALLALPVAAAGAAVAVRLALRRRSRRAIAAAPPREQVGLLYTALLQKLGRMGIAPATGHTPREFASEAGGRIAAFALPARDADWQAVTDAYERAHYGGQEPADADLAACWAFYDGFPACARKAAGFARYWTRSFWRV